MTLCLDLINSEEMNSHVLPIVLHIFLDYMNSINIFPSENHLWMCMALQWLTNSELMTRGMYCTNKHCLCHIAMV